MLNQNQESIAVQHDSMPSEVHHPMTRREKIGLYRFWLANYNFALKKFVLKIVRRIVKVEIKTTEHDFMARVMTVNSEPGMIDQLFRNSFHKGFLDLGRLFCETLVLLCNYCIVVFNQKATYAVHAAKKKYLNLVMYAK